MLRIVICLFLILLTTHLFADDWNPFMVKVLATQIFTAFKDDFQKADITFLRLDIQNKRVILKKRSNGKVYLIKETSKKYNKRILEISVQHTNLSTECFSGSFYAKGSLFVSGDFTICCDTNDSCTTKSFKYDIKPNE